jgi:GT2 family glycosyltransferase
MAGGIIAAIPHRLSHHDHLRHLRQTKNYRFTDPFKDPCQETAMQIHAVVVTYNRLPLLKKCIDAILHQTHPVDNLIVFNNSSDDGTEAYLASLQNEALCCIHSPENVGGAGGFFYGLKAAHERNADWIWAMDDDTIPRPDALEKLLSASFFPQDEDGRPTGYLASRVDWIDGNRHLMNYIHPVFPWHHFHGIHENCYRILNSSFVSILINREAIQKCGYPVKEFFIWGDDWEYTGRISRAFKCYYISDSVAVHETPVNSGTDFIEVNRNNIWKYKYAARNNAALRARSFLTVVELFISLLRDTRRMVRNKVALGLILLVWRHSIRGIFFNFEKFIQYPQADGSKREGHHCR